MNQIIFKKFITREFIKANKNYIFIFGDNDFRAGTGGQAKEMRREPNSYGIRVKHLPGTVTNAYYTDKDFINNAKKILEDFDVIMNLLDVGKTLVIPSDGIGTGLAKLSINAPKTLAFVNDCIASLVSRYNEK